MKSVTKFFMVVGILGLMMTSCDNRTEEQRWKDYQAKKEKARRDSIREARYRGFQVIVIDSCEYLLKTKTEANGRRGGFGYGFFSHREIVSFVKRDANKRIILTNASK